MFNTSIDLNKMSDQGRLFYIKDLLEDLTDCIKDLDKERVRYDYISHTVDHAHKAVKDLNKLLNK